MDNLMIKGQHILIGHMFLTYLKQYGTLLSKWVSASYTIIECSCYDRIYSLIQMRIFYQQYITHISVCSDDTKKILGL